MDTNGAVHLSEELLLQLFRDCVFAVGPVELERPAFLRLRQAAKQANKLSRVCRKWRRIMRDDSLWHEMHERFLGGPLRPPWADPASPPAPSPAAAEKIRAWIMNEEEERPGIIPMKIRDQCVKTLMRDTFLVSGDEDGDGKEPALTWRTSVMIKVREVAPCFSFLRRPPKYSTGKVIEWSKEGRALIKAALLGCVQVVELVSPSLSVPNEYGIINWNRIVGYACEGRSLEIVKMAAKYVDFSSAYFGSFGALLEVAARTGDMAIVRYLQQQIQAHPDLPVLEYFNPIASACRSGHLPVVEFLWKQALSVDISETGRLYQAAFEKALEGGHEDVVEFLAAQRPDRSSLAVWYAASTQNESLVRQLFRLGYPLTRDGYISYFHSGALTPRMMTLLIQELGLDAREMSWTLFTEPALCPLFPSLAKWGCDVNALQPLSKKLYEQQGIGTPLHYAVLQKDVRHVEWLLRAGADPEQKGQKCQTVKRLASAMDSHEILSLLKRPATYWKRLASEQEASTITAATGARGGGRKRARNQEESTSEADGEGKQVSTSKEKKARRGTKKARTSSDQIEQPGGLMHSKAEAEQSEEEEEEEPERSEEAEEPMLLVVEESAPAKLRKSRRLVEKRKASHG